MSESARMIPPSAANADWYVAHCDGGSRGNPGPAGCGAVIMDPKGQEVVHISEFLGIETNNVAEYRGLLAILRWATENRVIRLRVIADSLLMVNQVNGIWKVKNQELRLLREQAIELISKLPQFVIVHALRENNKTADRLANEAMDRGEKGELPDCQIVELAGGLNAPDAVVPDTPAPAIFSTSSPVLKPAAAASTPERREVEGFVRHGVVHLIGATLPEGAYVVVVHEPGALQSGQ